MLVARRYLIEGRVQGVGFRFFSQSAALAEGIQGWARNLPDGRVEIWAEGDRDAVDRFEGRIRRGPAGARVDQVVADDEAPVWRGGGFEVR